MRWKVPLAVAFACVLGIADVLACGNKFLVPSRGTRFGKVPVARQEARILVYAPPDSAVSTALGDVPVAALLAEAGYRPTTVVDPMELDDALNRGGWNLVLADTSSLPSRLEADDVPAILPVLREPSRTQVAEARRTYGEIIRSPSKSRRVVETVDFAVAEHRSRGATEGAAAAAR